MRMQGIRLDFSGVEPFVSKEELFSMENKIYECHDMLLNKNGRGSEMLGFTI